MRRPAAAVFLALAATSSSAEEPDVQWSLKAENDVGFGTDRWYTSGVRIARSSRAATEPTAASRAVLDLWKPESLRHQRVEWGVEQEIYTPDPKRQVGDVDRPYAGRLLLSLARQDYTADAQRTLEVAAGVCGPSAGGRQAQEWAHRIVPAPEETWDNQLPDQLDARATFAQSTRFALPLPSTTAWVHAGAVAGNMLTFLHAGTEVRWESDGASNLSPALRFAPTGPVLHEHSGIAWFAGVSARWILRNELLSQAADLFSPAPELKRGILRFAAGLAWEGRWGALSLSFVQDTREFEGQRDPHRFWSLAVHTALF